MGSTSRSEIEITRRSKIKRLRLGKEGRPFRGFEP